MKTKSAPPGAICFLHVLHKLQRLVDPTKLLVITERAHHFEQPAGHISRGRIDHSLHVAERHLIPQVQGVVSVKRAPASVSALHA